MKEYAFIDLHIHTEHSRKEDVRTTVKDLLDRLEAEAESVYKPVAFSITDHESILGCIEAHELIKNNPQKYHMLKLIPGIEFSTSLKSLGTEIDGSSIYAKCHILGYGYNLDDPELLNFSKIIYQKNSNPHNKGQTFKTGYSIIISKKILDKKYGKKLPFSRFESLTQAGLNHADVFDKFVDIAMTEYGITKEQIAADLDKVFMRESDIQEDALYNSKQDIFDIIDMIHNAGGYVCVAHANSIKYKHPDKHPFKDANDRKIYPCYEAIEIIQQRTGGKGIDGVELFHKENTDSSVFFVLEGLAKKYDLFITAGSDTHSPNLNSNIISRCNTAKLDKMTKPSDTVVSRNVVINKVVSLAIVEKLVDNIDSPDKQDFVVRNIFRENNLTKADIDAIMGEMVKPKAKAVAVANTKPTPKPVPKQNSKKKKKKKKYNKKKHLNPKKQLDYNPDDYYHAFSGKLKREYDKGKDF